MSAVEHTSPRVALSRASGDAASSDAASPAAPASDGLAPSGCGLGAVGLLLHARMAPQMAITHPDCFNLACMDDSLNSCNYPVEPDGASR